MQSRLRALTAAHSRSMLRCYNSFLALALLLICWSPATRAVITMNQTVTEFTEIEAMANLAQNIFPSTPQQMGQGWFLNIDPCGSPTCQPSNRTKCAWTGISCDSWHITGIQIQPSVFHSATGPDFQSGSLSSHIGDLPQLHTLQLANVGLTGILPPELGTLSKLQTVDLSSNQLSQFLPNITVQMPYLKSLNLSNNRLVGSVPRSWSNMTSLATLDLTNNAGLCNPLPNITTLSPASSSGSGFPPCTPSMAYAQANFNTTPSATLPPSPPPSPAESSPSPNIHWGQPTAYHMSSGINVSVSVLVGLCFLLGLCAGFVRIRQQHRRHRAMMSGLNQQRNNLGQWRGRGFPDADGAPLDAITAANNPFCGTPRLVLGPDGQQLTLARKLKQQYPEGAGQGLSEIIPNPAAGFPLRHHTQLYTAVLEVQTAADSTAAPQPVDLVGVTPSTGPNSAPHSGEHPTEASHTGAAALQTEAGASRPAAGGFLERVSQSLSRLSFQSLPPDQNQAALGQPPPPAVPAVPQASAEEAEASQASQQQHRDESGRWWWQFWR